MKCYADTSFLVSLYASDANSARADLWRQNNPVPLPLTPFHRLELRNAFWLAVFQRRCSVRDAEDFWKNVEEEMLSGLLSVKSAPNDGVWQSAELMVAPYTPVTGARSLDILHLALALSLGAEEVVTFDQRQAELALRLGLKVAVI